LEAPFEFWSVTVTETTATELTDWVAVARVKGMVRVNSVPKGFATAVLAYHVAKAFCTGTDTLFEVKVSPVAGAKMKDAFTMSRVEEKPVITTVTPPETCCKVTLLMNGTPGAFTMVCVVGEPRGAPLEERAVVSVMVPAVVPVNTVKLGAVVLPAGMVKVAVRPPPENWIMASSMVPVEPVGGVTDAVKVSVTVPVMADG
jgi:hypothetical protein